MLSRAVLVPSLLVLASCGTPPPGVSTSEEHRSAIVPNAAVGYAAERGLVDVRAVIPDVVCDLRYGTKHNITGQALYPADMPCLLNQSTAEKLRVAQGLLRAQGYGLKIWDAWRPPEVQTELFRLGGQTNMYLDPHVSWSLHCSGTAVDATLVDKRGHELRLPTYFDEEGTKASIYTPIPDERARQNVNRLLHAMQQAGFGMLSTEWWHFEDLSFRDPTTKLPVVFAQEIGVKLPAVK
jgi:D-alanyl-D-alanine dipeptidase